MNKQIIASVVIIAAAGVTSAWAKKGPITRVILGAYVLLLILSVLDLFGGPVSRLASALALIAALYVVINQFPWSTVIGLVQGKSSSTSK
jgi:hypothetical protein